MKRTILLVTFALFLVLSISIVSAARLPIIDGDSGTWGTILNEYLSKALGDNATILNISGDAYINGTLFGGSPLKFGYEGITFQDSSNDARFSIYQAQGFDYNVPSAFANSLIFQTESISNANNMEVCFWDKENQLMLFCINEGDSQRATTIRRSFQIVGNITAKENDENYTLCEGANFVDCDTDITGADLFVQDDIEAQSIYANENFNATGNLSLGQKITFALGEIIDNIVNGWITITGGLNVTQNLNVVGNVTIEGNLNVTGTSYFGDITIADNITVGTGKIWYNGSGICIGAC